MGARRKLAKVQASAKKEEVGKAVLVIHLGETRFSCPACTRSFRKGIVFEHGQQLYCSHRCLRRLAHAS